MRGHRGRLRRNLGQPHQLALVRHGQRPHHQQRRLAHIARAQNLPQPIHFHPQPQLIRPQQPKSSQAPQRRILLHHRPMRRQ